MADDQLERLRRQTIVIAVVLGVLIAAFFMLRTKDEADARDQASAQVKVGLMAYQEGDYQAARTNFTEAIRLDSKNALAHYNLGLIQQVIDANPSGAEARYREAIALRPDLSRALYNLGVLRAADGDTEEAITFYRRAITADEKLANAYFNLGLLLRQLDPASEEATTRINQALALNPTLKDRLPTTTSSTSTTITKR